MCIRDRTEAAKELSKRRKEEKKRQKAAGEGKERSASLLHGGAEGPIGGTVGGEWWSEALNLNLCGKSCTQGSAKRIIYTGTALIAVLLVTLLAALSASDGGSTAAAGGCAAEMEACNADVDCQALVQAETVDGPACKANSALSLIHI